MQILKVRRKKESHIASSEMFEEIKEKLKMRGFTDIQRAAMFYVQIKISYGSNTRTFGCNRKSLSSDYLEQVEKRLERVVIENRDFEIATTERQNNLSKGTYKELIIKNF